MFKLMITLVVCCGLYLAIAPASLLVHNSIGNFTNNGRTDIARMV